MDVFLGISLLFFSVFVGDSGDGGGIAGLPPGGLGNPDGLFIEGGSGKTKQTQIPISFYYRQNILATIIQETHAE